MLDGKNFQNLKTVRKGKLFIPMNNTLLFRVCPILRPRTDRVTSYRELCGLLVLNLPGVLYWDCLRGGSTNTYLHNFKAFQESI